MKNMPIIFYHYASFFCKEILVVIEQIFYSVSPY